MNLAGFPANTVFSGISFVTTEPAPITALSPTVTPGRIVEFEPIHTFLPILTGFGCILILSISLDTFSTQKPKLLGNQLSEMEQISMERSGMDICSISGAD